MARSVTKFLKCHLGNEIKPDKGINDDKSMEKDAYSDLNGVYEYKEVDDNGYPTGVEN